MPNILITTFGGTWQIIPELLGFTNPDLLDLYAQSSGQRLHSENPGTCRAFSCGSNLDDDHGRWLTDVSIGKVGEWYSLLSERNTPPSAHLETFGCRRSGFGNGMPAHGRGYFQTRPACLGNGRFGGQLIVSLAGGRKP